MAKDWDYARMVQYAAVAGGPDACLETIKMASYRRGASDMKNKLVIPLLLSGVFLGTIGTVAYQKISKLIFDRKKEGLITEQEATIAEEFLENELNGTLKEFNGDNIE